MVEVAALLFRGEILRFAQDDKRFAQDDKLSAGNASAMQKSEKE